MYYLYYIHLDQINDFLDTLRHSDEYSKNIHTVHLIYFKMVSKYAKIITDFSCVVYNLVSKCES